MGSEVAAMAVAIRDSQGAMSRANRGVCEREGHYLSGMATRLSVHGRWRSCVRGLGRARSWASWAHGREVRDDVDGSHASVRGRERGVRVGCSRVRPAGLAC